MKDKNPIGNKFILYGIAAVVTVAILILLLVVGWKIIMRPNGPGPKETTETTLPTETTTEPTPPTTEIVFEQYPLLPKNPYGKNDFQYYGDYLKCLAGESVMGIDVSRYQGNIDWEQVWDAGVKFAMIRVGGRSYGEDGEIYDDINAQVNYNGAKAAGLDVGVYFFAQAINLEEAREEAEYVLDKIRDWDLDMPVVYDWEYVSSKARTAEVDNDTLTACTLEFCRIIEEAGYEPMVYFNPTQARSRVNLEALMEYKFWLAMYSERMTYPYKIDMWQYTDQGTVPGIEGFVDINLFFVYD